MTVKTEVAAKPRNSAPKTVAELAAKAKEKGNIENLMKGARDNLAKHTKKLSAAKLEELYNTWIKWFGYDDYKAPEKMTAKWLTDAIMKDSDPIATDGGLFAFLVEERILPNMADENAAVIETAARGVDHLDDLEDDMSVVNAALPDMIKQLKAAGIQVAAHEKGDLDADAEITIYKKGPNNLNIQIDSQKGCGLNWMANTTKGGVASWQLGYQKSLTKLIPTIKKHLEAILKDGMPDNANVRRDMKREKDKTTPATAKKSAKTKSIVSEETKEALEGHDMTVEETQKIVDALNKKVGSAVTVGDYAVWYTGEGTGSEKKMDAAVNKLVGKKARDIGEGYARLSNLVDFALGLGPDMIGGISMKAILENTRIKTAPVGSKDKDASTRAKAPIEIFGAVTLKGKEYQDDAMSSLIGQNLTGVKYAGGMSDKEGSHVVKIGNDKKDFAGKPFVSTTEMLKYVKGLMKAGHPMPMGPKAVARRVIKDDDEMLEAEDRINKKAKTATAKPMTPKQKEQLRSVNTALKKLKAQKGVAQYIKLAKMAARLKSKLG